MSELGRSAVEPNPFYEPENLLHAAMNMPGGSDVLLAFVKDGNQMLGALPVRRLLTVGGVEVITSRPFQVINLGTPLLTRDAPEETMTQLLRVLADESGAGVLALESLGDGGAVGKAVRDVATSLEMPCKTYKQWQRPVLHRNAGAACTQTRCTLCQSCALLSPKRAKALARWQRGLARELGGLPEVTDRSGQPEWVERYLSLERSGWKGAMAEGTGDLVHRPGHAQWFRSAALDLSASGLAHLFSLTAGTHLLAMFYVLVSPGRGLFGYYMCYEEKYRCYAPGVQLLLETMRFFFQDSREEFFDSCTVQDNAHFPEFFPDSRTISNVAIGISNFDARQGFVAEQGSEGCEPDPRFAECVRQLVRCGLLR